ncbi:MAG: uracil phosphoribosyltransferase [Bacteroidota bacterium]
MKNLVIVDHPLIRRDLSTLRDRRTERGQFRTTLRRISSLIAFEVTKDLALKPRVLHTPLEETTGHSLSEDIVFLPVLRAGLGMAEGFLDFLPEAKVGHIGLYRDEETLKPIDYYSNFPKNLKRSLILVLDPMLATGGSATAAISFIKEKGGRRIRLVSVVAAPEGVKKVSSRHRDVKIYAAALDRRLNSKGYILPGLGDAGDRTFGTD